MVRMNQNSAIEINTKIPCETGARIKSEKAQIKREKFRQNKEHKDPFSHSSFSLVKLK